MYLLTVFETLPLADPTVFNNNVMDCLGSCPCMYSPLMICNTQVSVSWLFLTNKLSALCPERSWNRLYVWRQVRSRIPLSLAALPSRTWTCADVWTRSRRPTSASSPLTRRGSRGRLSLCRNFRPRYPEDLIFYSAWFPLLMEALLVELVDRLVC